MNNRGTKQRARALMKERGISYMQALRVLQGDDKGRPAADPATPPAVLPSGEP